MQLQCNEGRRFTNASLLPTNLLNKADLPTLGRPTTATCSVHGMSMCLSIFETECVYVQC